MKYAGIDPTTLSPFISVNGAVDEGMPMRELRFIQLPKGAGYAGASTPPRQITVTLNIAGRTKCESLSIARRLAAWATHDTPQSLVLPHEPHRQYHALCVNSSQTIFQGKYLVITYTFWAPDPLAHSVQETAHPLGLSFLYEGFASTGCTIEQTLTQDAQTVRFVLDGGRYVQLCGTLTAGQRIVIDTNTHTVHVGGQLRPDLLDYVNSRWFALAPGTHVIASTDTGTGVLRYHAAWL